MFTNYQHRRDMITFLDAIDNAPVQVPCVNFPEAFYPIQDEYKTTDIRIAKSLCETCPVLNECAVFAFKWEDEGIWGGLTARERLRIKSRYYNRVGA